MKWGFVASEPATPRYIVCNADESEPGTFKDRTILEGDPHAVLGDSHRGLRGRRARVGSTSAEYALSRTPERAIHRLRNWVAG